MKRKQDHLYIMILLCSLMLSGTLFARNAPITTAGSSSACIGGAVTVPVTVTGFTSIKAITLRLEFDPTQMTFVNFTNLNTTIAGASVNMTNIGPTLSKIMIVWADITAISMTDGSKLVDLNFTLLTGSPAITFNNTSNGGGDCEYADENGLPMNDVPTATYYINGTITSNALGAAGTITGTTILCAGTGNIAYSVPEITNATGYTWTVPTGGSIISGNNTHSIVVNYSNAAVSGNVTVKGTNSCGSGTPSSLAITVNPLPVPSITGPATVCSGSAGLSYSTATGMSGYSWTITGGTITTGAATATAIVTWTTPGAQSISVTYTNSNGCSAASPTVKAISVNPQPTPTISGPSSLCSGSANVPYSTEPSMSAYTWSISTGGTIVTGGSTSSVLVNWNLPGPQSLSVNYAIPATGCTASIPALKPVTINALPIPTISGPSAVCIGSPGNVYTTEPGMTGYIWNVSSGGSITGGGGISSNSVTVTWNGTGAQSVSCSYTNSNNCSSNVPTIKTVTVNPLLVPTLLGPLTVCNGSSGNVYATETGMTGYIWTVSGGGSVTSGGGPANNSVTVTWITAGAQNVSVIYTPPAGCAAPNPVSVNVTVNPVPVPSITGPATVCEGATGNAYSTEAGMTNYQWTISAGGSITSGLGTSNITVSWNATGSQLLAVNYSNSNGCAAGAPVSKPVAVAPFPGPAGSITGTSNVCAGTNGVSYSTDIIPNTSSYLWTLPAGASVATGAGTNSITVDFGNGAISGDITVKGTNSCGNGTTSPPFTVSTFQMPLAAGTINGPGIVCAGTHNVIYSIGAIINAVTYVWTVPAGASIMSGAGTNQIVVDFSPLPGNGLITVKGSNICGNGPVSPDLTVTMIASQAAPVVTSNGALLTSSASTGNQWYYEGTGAIAGATGSTYTATITGWYWTTVVGTGCPFLESNHVYVLFEGLKEQNPGNFEIIPVPSDGRFRITLKSPSAEHFTILIFDQTGRKVFERDDIPVNGITAQVIDIRPAACGIYSVVFLNSSQVAVRKVMVR